MNKRISLLALIILSAIFITGCWNYREVDELTIVAGAAIDKGPNGKYIVTAEIVQISGGRDSKTTSKTITMEGNTVFDAVRNGISLSGKKLYWSHTKVLILSKDIASQGLKNALQWYNRDTETREDVHLLISEAASAKEIFKGQGTTEDVKSFTLDEMLKNQVSLSKAPVTDILHFDIESRSKGLSPIIPVVNLKQINKQMVPEVMGTAIIKDDKLVGFLNGEETKDLNFIRNEVKGGVLIEEMPAKNLVALEIFNNKTKIKPEVEGKDIKINLNTDTTVAIDEEIGAGNFFDEEGRTKLEQSAQNRLKRRIEGLIKKVQSDYGADIFGFGAKLREDKVKVWDSVSNNWEEVFRDLPVKVKTRVHIKNSAEQSKSLDAGE